MTEESLLFYKSIQIWRLRNTSLFPPLGHCGKSGLLQERISIRRLYFELNHLYILLQLASFNYLSMLLAHSKALNFLL